MDSFFASFSSLGYSAINLVLIFVVFVAVIFRAFKFHLRPARSQIIAALVLLAIAAVPFVMTVNFLSSENKRLNEAIRADGGLKRELPENMPGTEN